MATGSMDSMTRSFSMSAAIVRAFEQPKKWSNPRVTGPPMMFAPTGKPPAPPAFAPLPGLASD